MARDDVTDPYSAAERRVDARNDLLVALFFAALGAGMVIIGVVSPPPARVNDVIGPYGFAIVVGSLICLCAAFIAIRDVAILRSSDILGKPEPIVGRASDEPDVPASSARAMTMAALTVVYAIVLEPLGYIFTAMLFIATALWLMDVRSWKLIFFSAFLFAATTFAIFGLGLGVAVPLGPLNDLFVDLNIVDPVR